jgi:hypothetical protein
METPINKVIENGIKCYDNDELFGFYDFFCTEKSLKNRTKGFIPKLKFLVKMGVLDGDKTYAWFKNNCPMCYPLYDDMRFSRIKDDEFLGGIIPKYSKDNTCEVWWFENKNAYVCKQSFKNWSEFKKALKENQYGITDTLKKHWKNK